MNLIHIIPRRRPWGTLRLEKRPTMRMVRSLLPIVLALSAAAGASAQGQYALDPGLGRMLGKAKQIAADQEQKHQKDLANDIADGKKYAEDADKEYKPTKNPEYQARVDRIGQELANIARTEQVKVTWGDPRLNPYQYTFKVVQGDDVNAFSLPGGYIYVFDGLVKYVESDDELAGVLAHEISHASFRHLATLRREQSKLEAITLPLILLSLLTGGASAGPLVYGGVLTGQAIGSGWSVKAEQSADYGGFQYMLKSKYNPVGMLTFMERLAFDERTKEHVDWGIFRTHPPGRERANTLIERLNELAIPIKRSAVSTSLRSDVKAGDSGVELWFGTIKIHSFSGTEALERADKAAERLNAYFDQVPKLFESQKQGDATIVGKGVDLITVTEDDASAAKTTTVQMADETLKAIKRATFELSYRVWDAY